MHLSRKHGYTINEIKKDGFKINAKVSMVPKEDTTYGMTNSLGKGIIEFSEIFRKFHPDINVILGDRDEAFASAIASSHMNTPTAHIHGGDKTQAGIDEYNRHAITKISNIHFTATAESKKRVLKLGENPQYVFLTGSPAVDEIKHQKISNKIELRKKFQINFVGKEIILLYHPVTTEILKSEQEIKFVLESIIKLKKQTLAIAPNSDAGSNLIFDMLESYSKRYPFIKLYTSVSRSDYLGFLKNAGVLVGNSSSGLIEGSYFDIRVIDIGIRQLHREHGKNVINIKKVSIPKIKLRKKNTMKNKIYGSGNASKKITEILGNIKLDEKLIKKQIFY